MTRFRSDQNATPRLNRDHLLIQLHSGVGGALENIIDLGQGPVVMQTGRFEDFCDMNGRRKVSQITERPLGESTRALYSRDRIEVGDLIAGMGGHLL